MGTRGLGSTWEATKKGTVSSVLIDLQSGGGSQAHTSRLDPVRAGKPLPLIDAANLGAIVSATQVFYNVERPTFAAEWQWRLQIQLLFPK